MKLKRDSTFLKAVGERIKEIRKRASLNQAEFGRKIGENQCTIARMERGINGLSARLLKKVCEVFQVGPSFILFGPVMPDGRLSLETVMPDVERHQLKGLISQLIMEYQRARYDYPAFSSPFEGWAVIKREMDELWDEVRAKFPSRENLAVEAVQIGGLVLKFLVDVCGSKERSCRTSKGLRKIL